MNQDPRDLTRAQELVYELKVEQVMTRDVITIAPDCSMVDLKELLRTRRISGVPVLGDGELVGIVTMEDLLAALEHGEISASVREKMTSQVQTVAACESVVSAVDLFAQLGYGRFPVVDDTGSLVGILTKGDIVRGVLRQMEVDWHAEEIRRYRASHIFEDIESDQTTLLLRYELEAGDLDHAGEASTRIKRALRRLGAHPEALRRVAIAAYEAETNVIIHSSGGQLIAEVLPHRAKITAVDTGPGIPDIERALAPGSSTAPQWVKDLGFGAGMGLCNIKACADKMKLRSEMGAGTCLEACFEFE